MRQLFGESDQLTVLRNQTNARMSHILITGIMKQYLCFYSLPFGIRNIWLSTVRSYRDHIDAPLLVCSLAMMRLVSSDNYASIFIFDLLNVQVL